jgi:hypothetical protein
MNTYSTDNNKSMYVDTGAITDTISDTITDTISEGAILINTTIIATTDISNNSVDDANSFMKSVSSQYDMLHNIIDVSRTKIMNDIKQRLLDECKQLTIDKPRLIKLLVRGMEIIDTFDIKGDDKKKTIIEVLILLLETNGIDIPNKDSLIIFLKEDASNFIDIIIDASKGKINVNKIEHGIINCLFKCLHIR